MTTLTISISGTTTATVVRPDGSTANTGDPATTIINLSTGTIFSFVNPVSGVWKVTVGGSGNVSVIASGESDIQFGLFRFVEPGGRPGHEGFYPIDGFPLAGQTAIVEAKVDGVSILPQFQFLTQTGTILQTLTLTSVPGTTNEFSGAVIVPNVPFVVSAGGVDSSGTAFQRIVPASIRPQAVEVRAPAIQDLLAGQTTTYSFQINNLGSSDTFQITASDNRGYVASVSPSSVTVQMGGSANVSVQLEVPAGTSGVTSDTLTVTATSPTTGASNFAILTSPVTLNRPPDVSQAAPSTAILWPPNHKMVPITILGVTDPDGDPFTIQITGISQDEPTNGLGDGDTCPDGQGINSATVQLRAERSGTGNGRVYTITFTATDSKGASSTGSVTVAVPHDMHSTAIDDGAKFDSTSCFP